MAEDGGKDCGSLPDFLLSTSRLAASSRSREHGAVRYGAVLACCKGRRSSAKSMAMVSPHRRLCTDHDTFRQVAHLGCDSQQTFGFGSRSQSNAAHVAGTGRSFRVRIPRRGSPRRKSPRGASGRTTPGIWGGSMHRRNAAPAERPRVACATQRANGTCPWRERCVERGKTAVPNERSSYQSHAARA